MFVVRNLSNNPLPLSDGKMLAFGRDRKLDAVGDAERKYEARGWLSIIEEKEQPKTEEKDGGKNK